MLRIVSGCILLLFAVRIPAAVVISELHYHPVERPAFLADGTPALNLDDDVHEFVELHNSGTTAVNLAGWRLEGGIGFTFPPGASLAARGFVVVARDPVRLRAVTNYALPATNVFGPFSGQLANERDTVRLRDVADQLADAVSYSSSFPWAISANALGAEDEWTGLDSAQHQYRGRSLERVSFTHPANDPANWLASPLARGPSPGRSNAVNRVVPAPVVLAFTVAQAVDGDSFIRSNQPVRLDAYFSASTGMTNVRVEYFADNIELTNEAVASVSLVRTGAVAEARFTGIMPAQPARTIVRYRIRANRGAGDEVVSPRADDPFAWHAWFASPARVATRPAYDCFISTASLNRLAANISQTPRRVTLPDPPGMPRDSWNATEPAVMVHGGEVFDIRMRHHGSRYNRSVGRNSFKWTFPRYHRFRGLEGIFETDKGDAFVAAAALFEAAGLPVAAVRYVDVYLNNTALVRLEQDEMDEHLARRWAATQAALHPGTDPEPVGEFYKATGVVPSENGEGPYGVGSFRRLDPIPPWWTKPDRYAWTYGIQSRSWLGASQFTPMIEGFWAARGDTHVSPGLDLAATRAWLAANIDVDAMLTYMALRNWSAPLDDVTHNYFLWRRASGRWSMLPWDNDGEFGGFLASSTSIYIDEDGNPSNTAIRGPNWLKDAMFKCYRDEYRRRLFVLNNTLLQPTNITRMGLGMIRSWADARVPEVNAQLGLGAFYRPARPVALSPTGGVGVLPGAVLAAGPYAHGAPEPVPHATTTWWIRHASNTWAAPVFRLTSATDRLSLPVPFERLTFGEPYAWKCSFADTNGHPSEESAEAVFVYGASLPAHGLVTMDAGTRWRYWSHTNAGYPPADWMQPGYNDGAWPEGAPLLADETAALPEPIRTPLVRSNRLSFQFRTTFNFPHDPATARLRLRQIIDDGVILYLNGVEVSRTRLPAGAILPTTPAAATVGDAVYEGLLAVTNGALRTGLNVLAAEVHQSTPASPDVTFGLHLEALVPPPPGAIRLSEVVANPGTNLLGNAPMPDFIELENTSDTARDLAGLSLSDRPDRPGRFVFPAGTIVPPRGFIVVWCDGAGEGDGLQADFRLDDDGQTVALFGPTEGGYEVTDSLAYGLQVPGRSLVRNGTTWTLGVLSPGTSNQVLALGPASALRLNEWMASSASGPDWFELHNTDTRPVALGGLHFSDSAQTPTNTRITALSFIDAGGFRDFVADGDDSASPRHVGFSLRAAGESLVLADANGVILDQVNFGPQLADVSQGRLPDGGPAIVSFTTTVSPGSANYLPVDGLEFSEIGPDVELHNVGAVTVDLAGWWLSDDPGQLRKHPLPGGVRLAPGEYYVVAGASLPFALNRETGGRLVLSHDDVFRLEQAYDLDDGHSQGSVVTSGGTDFVRLTAPTFGGANALPVVGPVVISEIQYHPPELPGDDSDYEYVELTNLGPGAVPLHLAEHPDVPWRLRDAVGFTFPAGTVLAPGERVLVVPFDPGTNAHAVAAFQRVYGVPAGVRWFGPYSGRLNNSGDSVELVEVRMPVSTPGPAHGTRPELVLDRVRYRPMAPWPEAAAGTGAALQRRLISGHGNDPANWYASGVTPGLNNESNIPPTIAITAPVDGFVTGVDKPFNVIVAAGDADGFLRRVEIRVDGVLRVAFTNAPFTWLWDDAVAGIHVLTARTVDERLSTVESAPVTLLVTNQEPFVRWVTPMDGSWLWLTNTVRLQAEASDSDGGVARVEFWSDGELVGTATAEPFQWDWSDAPPGRHTLVARAVDRFGLPNESAPVTIVVHQPAYVAYEVPAGTPGAQNVGFGLGHDFDVVESIVVTRLGAFDAGGDGFGAGPITVELWDRIAGRVLASQTFTGADPGVLAPGTSSRFKPLAEPVPLGPGGYTIVGSGFSDTDPNGNAGLQARVWAANNGGGWVRFTGTGRFGGHPGLFPPNVDTGPADRYAAATFEFRAARAPRIELRSPTNGAVRLTATNLLLEVDTDAPGDVVSQVEFFDDEIRLATVTAPPFQYSWTNPASGQHQIWARATTVGQGIGVSRTNLVTLVSLPFVASTIQAYTVPAGTLGNQFNASIGLGHDFHVNRPVEVVQLGAFDSGTNGFAPATVITVQLFHLSTATLLASLTFDASAPGVLTPGTANRFKSLPAPLLLPPGDYTVVAYGHNATDPNGNSGGQARSWTTSDGGGLLTFIGTARYGGTPGTLPANLDAGPADRYAAASFKFRQVLAPLILTAPEDGSWTAGDLLVLSVFAVGSEPMTYQWLFQNTPLAGATTPVLRRPGVAISDSGDYTVVVANAAGTNFATAKVVVGPWDTDGDGLPDEWELLHGTDPFQSDAVADPDEDGLRNRDEWLAGTDPRDAASTLRLEWKLPLESPGRLVLGFAAQAGRTYDLGRRAVLAEPGGGWERWATVGARPTNRWFWLTNDLPGTARWFFRVQTPAEP